MKPKWRCILLTLFLFNIYSHATLADDYHLLLLSDIHLGAKSSMNLEPTNFNDDNDLDLETFRKLLGHIHQLISTNDINPNASLLLGDLVDHKNSNIKEGTIDSRREQIHHVFYYLSELFEKNAIPITYVFGNNDSLSGDYKEFYSSDSTTEHSPYDIAKNTGWRGGFLSNDAQCQIDINHYPCILDENQFKGYYVERLNQNLKLIVLNSVLFNNRVACTTDCKSELEWLKNQLQIAHNNNESVLLAMHIPPGIDPFKLKPIWNFEAKKEFLSNLQSYGDTVIGVLTAHTHMEELQLIKLKNKPVIPIIYTAALSTAHGNLPSFKYLSLSQDPINGTWAIKNYTTYHYLNERFQVCYDFNTQLCKNYDSESMSSCLQNVAKEDLNILIDLFNDWYTVGNPSFKLDMNTKNPNDFILQETVA